jgi:hypothetical protein
MHLDEKRAALEKLQGLLDLIMTPRATNVEEIGKANNRNGVAA